MDHEQFVKDNFTLLNQITSLLIEENVSPEVGERVLLWLAGLSMGRRHKILIGSDDLKLLATARKVGTGTVMGDEWPEGGAEGGTREPAGGASEGEGWGRDSSGGDQPP